MSTRNAQSQKVKKYALLYNAQIWLDWVKSRNAQNVSLVDFYLGSIRSKDNVDIADEEKEFIIRELFLDAIDNGALGFTGKVSPEDVSFRLDRSDSLSYDACLVVGAKKLVGSGVWGDRWLRLTADTACDIFGDFVWVIQDVAK